MRNLQLPARIDASRLSRLDDKDNRITELDDFGQQNPRPNSATVRRGVSIYLDVILHHPTDARVGIGSPGI